MPVFDYAPAPESRDVARLRGSYGIFVDGQFRVGAGEAPDALPDGLVERTLDALRPLRDAGLPLVLEHGDTSHPNLLLRRFGDLAVVDWELANPDGLPG